MVGVPVQMPLPAVRVWPSCALPLIVGSTVLTGGAAATVPLCALVALALPPTLAPVTTTRTVLPTSAPTRAYVDPVAPAMSTQFAPALSQRRHWRVKEMVGEPVH